MKNAAILVLGVMVFGLGWYALRTMRMTFHGEKGELRPVERGDLTIPVNATGEVRYESLTEIKSEASGTVAERFFEAGDLIRKGDLLIRLDPEDEQRNVDRARAELVRAEAALKRAGIIARQRREIGVPRARAELDGIIAQLADAKHNRDRLEALYTGRESSPRELVQARATYDRLLASKAGAEAARGQAKIAIEIADNDVVSAQAAFTTAQKNLSDAEERLRETEIFSPIDGMVTRMLVQEGEVIQTGKGSFTGGTVLAVVADISAVYVRAEVDEADFGVVREIAPAAARPGGNAAADSPDEAAPPGDDRAKVRVLVEAYHDEGFSGVIQHIYPEPRKAASVVTYYVDILVTGDNRDKLEMGMQADVEFTAQSVRDVLLVRHDAIHKEAGDLGVYVPVRVEGRDDPEPTFRKCRFGLDNGLFAEVLEGDLKEGDAVYTKLPRTTEEEE